MIGNVCGCYWTCRPDSECYHIDHATSTVPAVVARAVPVYMLRRTPPSHCGTLRVVCMHSGQVAYSARAPRPLLVKPKSAWGWAGPLAWDARTELAGMPALVPTLVACPEASPSSCLSMPELAKLSLRQVPARPGQGAAAIGQSRLASGGVCQCATGAPGRGIDRPMSSPVPVQGP
jgi:hypothetical protein